MNKFELFYERNGKKYDPLVLWSGLLQLSNGNIELWIKKCMELKMKHDKKECTNEEYVDLNNLIKNVGEIGKEIFADDEEKTLFVYYKDVLDFVSWLSKKD